MFTIATTNMILRGGGKSNLINEDFLKQDANKLQLKGSKQNPDLYEIVFTGRGWKPRMLTEIFNIKKGN